MGGVLEAGGVEDEGGVGAGVVRAERGEVAVARLPDRGPRVGGDDDGAGPTHGGQDVPAQVFDGGRGRGDEALVRQPHSSSCL